MELPEAVQEEYSIDRGNAGLLIYKLKADLPTKTTVKRNHERITRKSSVAKGIMTTVPKLKKSVENKAVKGKEHQKVKAQ